MSVINMQTMRYINLLDKTSRVKTRKCFLYNNSIIFAVPKALMSKAIGADASNIKKLQEKFGKRVRVIKEPANIEDAQRFISDLITPIKFKSLEIKDKQIIISAGGTQNKAALIGRNKRRLIELKQIVEDTFHLDLKIIW